MQYLVKANRLSQAEDTLVVGVYDEQKLTVSAQELDLLTGKYLSQLVKSGEINGKVGDITILRNLPNLACQRVVVVGCGKQGELNPKDLHTIYTKAYSALIKTSAQIVVSYLTELDFNQGLDMAIRFAILALNEANYSFNQYKTLNLPQDLSLREIILAVAEKDISVAQQALSNSLAIAHGMNATKDLANQPPNVCNPEYLATQAQKLAQASGKITTEIVNEQTMAELGMHAYLTVSQGSANEAKMAIMTYNRNPQAKPIVLVGKGLTFDAGGISLKPSDGMDEMKYDMCGAATVFGVMTALAEMDLPLNVIGIMAGCENLPDGKAYRPGDIIKSMAGITIEVLNTDAEGRLVLCDALTYVERFNPEMVIDMATLTGACVVALGAHYSGLMTENEKLATELLSAGQRTQDKAWRLPLGADYSEQLKSNFADLANIGGRWGGASTAGAFLSHFTKKYPWAHLDIAGTSWKQGDQKGATARPLHMLMQFLMDQCK